MRRSFVVCVLLAATACQSYSAVALSAVPVGAHVQIDLTENGSNAVATNVGAHVAQLEGRVSRVDPSGLSLVLSELTRSGGTTEIGEDRTVTVPADAVAVVRVESLSATRSLLLAGAVVAGSILAGRSLGVESGSATKGGGTVATGQ